LLNARVLGISLGMTKAAVSKSMGGIVWKTQADGTDLAIQTDFQDKTRFAGVRLINFHFFRNALYRIGVQYDESVDAGNLMAFADAVSKGWRMKEKWSDARLSSTIECRERTALVTSNRNLSLTDNIAAERIEKARK